MRALHWGLAIVLGLFLLGMGVMKFTGAHIFQFIEARAAAEGLPLAGYFYPLMNNLVGAAEIIAGALILIPATRFLGSVLGAGIIAGALAFHLSGYVGLPYLGIATPTGLAEGAAPPWDMSDFVPADPAQYSPMLFILALAMFAVALANIALSRPRSHPQP